jgi:rfaE bifunctional protein nucleotidyltransferase chain/domain
MTPDPIEALIQQRLRERADLLREFGRECSNSVQAAADAVVECLARGKRILVLGNGESARDAEYFAAELIDRFKSDRLPIPALAVTTDTSTLTAVWNTRGFEEVLARRIRAAVSSGDVVIAISTSGRSPDILKAVRAAREAGANTIGLTSEDGHPLTEAVDIGILVPSTSAARIQEVHIAALHILCELVESSLLPAIGWLTNVPKGIVAWGDLLKLRDGWAREGKVVAWTNGCFDVLHVGHLHSLEQAKKLGDVLVVGINTDAAVRELKGQDRPIFPVEERMRLVAGFRTTDYVVEFDGLTPEGALLELRPDVHVKGEDYAPPSGKPMPEKEVVESYGGRIEFVSIIPTRSTTAVARRIPRSGDTDS